MPAQTVEDFLKGKKGEVLKSSSPSGAAPVNFNEILPQSLTEPLKNSLSFFEKRMPGFSGKEAMLHGVESRTSCPIRVDRDKETHESLSHKGLYPTGEGAGYAGGITSAAVDGIRIAESIASLLSSQTLQIQQS